MFESKIACRSRLEFVIACMMILITFSGTYTNLVFGNPQTEITVSAGSKYPLPSLLDSSNNNSILNA